MAGGIRGPSRYVGYQPNELTGVLDVEMLMDGILAWHVAPALELILRPQLGSRSVR